MNLFSEIPGDLPDELVETLIRDDRLRIQRIVSHGHASPEGFWYDQSDHEWVVVLRGAATLRFEGQDQPLQMQPGDWTHILAHRRHRVEWTTPDEPTIWLVVHHA